MADVTLVIEALDKTQGVFNAISLSAAATLGFATKSAIDFDTAMSGASRALDLSGSEVEGFKKEILAIAPPLGMLPTAFADLATEAGKLGVGKKDIAEFSRIVAEISAITDVTGEGVNKMAASFAALQTITGISTKDLEVFGSAVNKLDDSIGGTTPEIIEFVRQTAAAGKLLRLDVKDLAAYGSALQSLGVQNGVAFRSFNALLTKLAAPQTLSAKAGDALGELGLSAQQMAKIMTTDANQGIDLFLGRIREVAKTDVSKALGATKTIIGADYADEILTLALASDKYKAALVAVDNTSGNLAKKQDEVAKKLGSVKGQLAIAGANAQKLGIIIGEALLPPINGVLSAIIPAATAFGAFAQANPGIVQIGVGLLSVLAVIAPVTAAVVSFGKAIAAISGLFASLKAIAVGITLAPAFVAGVAAALPFLAVTAAITSAAALIITNWNPLSKFFSGLWERIVAINKTAMSAMASGISATISAITGVFGQASSILGQLTQQAYSYGIGFINAFGQGIAAAFNGLIINLQNQIAYLRSFLPSSDAQRGALSDLSKSGQKLWETFSGGLEVGLPTAKRAIATGSSQLMPSLQGGAGNSSSQVITINFSPSINGNQSDDLIAALRAESQRLLDMLATESKRLNRGQL